MVKLLSITTLLAALSIVGCNNPQKFIPEVTTLSSDRFLTNGRLFENSMAVIPPRLNGTSCYDGSIIFLPGSMELRDTSAKAYFDTVFSLNYTYNSTPPMVSALPAEKDNYSIQTDNHIIRLKDGSLLAMRLGFINSPSRTTQRPEWWNYYTSYYTDSNARVPTGKRLKDGTSATVYFWRSTDCGKTWSQWSTIDAINVLGGKYAYPRIVSSVPDTIAWPGGWDRPELYADPFHSGTVYITFAGVHPNSFPPKNELYGDDFSGKGFVFYSSNYGRNWNFLDSSFNLWGPIVMTSSPSGNLYLFQIDGKVPILKYCNIFNGTPMSPAIPILGKNDLDRTKLDSAGIDGSSRLTSGINTPSIARINGNEAMVRVSYPFINEFGKQQFKIVNVAIANDRRVSTVNDITIAASDRANYSAVYGQFIEPDYIDKTRERGFNSDLSLFYWVETPATNSGKANVKFVLFNNIFQVTSPRYLTIKNNRPDSFALDAGNWQMGHYLQGAFFYNYNTLNYAVHWLQQDSTSKALSVHYNIVTVADN